MAFPLGGRLGPYEILALLGAGGMGEVYRARDTQLKREVAIKVLPGLFADDPERLARFTREAQTLAALNHPNIAHIHGLEVSDEVRALIMELVEGDDLSALVARGPMPPDRMLPIARQIAEALEAAHEQGIVHRDLKPANIKVRPDGAVKVLDFGIAKALISSSGPAGTASESPTLTALATEAGVILGTAEYMSPEQVQGRVVDRRADIWAFGVVLFEMVSGRRPFEGEGRSETLAAVLRQDVDWAALPADTPAVVRRLLARCLERDVKRRLRDIGEARIALEDSSCGEAETVHARPHAGWRHAVLGASVAVALTSAAWYVSREPAPPLAVTQFTINLPEGQVFTGLSGRAVALSPDGALMAFVANGRLHLRSMADLDSKPIEGTEGLQAVADPVFSPDGRSIAFHAVYDQTLKRIAITGGAAVTIAQADLPLGLDWGPNGIVYGQSGKGILRVSPTGGPPETLVAVKDGEQAYGPQLLPGGSHVLFTLATGASLDRWDQARIVVQSLASGERKTVVEGGSDARYVKTGHLVYALGGRALAVAFDLRRLEVTSSPVPMIEGVRRSSSGGGANFIVSDSGTLAYVPGPATGSGSAQLGLALVDRKGAVQPLKLPGGAYTAPRVSPDGTRIAVGVDDGKEAMVWTSSLSGTSAPRRLTFGGNNRFPIWSSDGRRIAFQSDRDGDEAIFWQPADGSGVADRLTRPDPGTSHEPESWAPGGKTLLFNVTKQSDVSLWTFSLADGKATPFGAVHSLTRTNAVFSPDGRWVAYARTEQGRTKGYVHPFPPTGPAHQLAAETASQLLWAPDGKELFYNPRPGAIEVVAVTTTPSVAFGVPVEVPRPFQTGPPAARRAFDITPGGQFVGLIAAGQTEAATREMNSQVRVVLNWLEELKVRVPPK